MRNLTAYLNNAKKDLDAIGIKYGYVEEIVPNTRAKSRWGQCRKLPNGNYSINVNVELLDERKSPNDKGLKNTVMHELLHTVEGGHGHTGVWLSCANKVNQVYGLGITRCSSASEKGVENHERIYRTEDDNKYCLECTKCGYRWYYSRMGKAVKYADKCQHSTDGGFLRRVW